MRPTRTPVLMPLAALGLLMSGCSLYDKDSVTGSVASQEPTAPVTSAIAGEWILASTPPLRLKVSADGGKVTGVEVTSAVTHSDSGETALGSLTDFQARYDAVSGSTLLSFKAKAEDSANVAVELPVSLRVTPSDDDSTLTVQPETKSDAWPAGTHWKGAHAIHALWDTDHDLHPDTATTAYRLADLVADETHHQTIALGFSSYFKLYPRELMATSFTLESAHVITSSIYADLTYGALMVYGSDGKLLHYGVSYHIHDERTLEPGTYHLIFAPGYGGRDGATSYDYIDLSLSGTPATSG
jgi:hypothetical protein